MHNVVDIRKSESWGVLLLVLKEHPRTGILGERCERTRLEGRKPPVAILAQGFKEPPYGGFRAGLLSPGQVRQVEPWAFAPSGSLDACA